jgi:hypothetical protein
MGVDVFSGKIGKPVGADGIMPSHEFDFLLVTSVCFERAVHVSDVD